MREDLRDPKTLAKIGKWRNKGKTWNTVEKKVKEDLGIDACLSTIKKVYDEYSARSAEVVAGDKELKNTLKQAVLDTANQLEEINNVMKEILAQNRNKPEQKIAAAKEILSQLRFQEKVLDRLTRGFDMDKINKIEYTKISVNNLKELEKAGYIKIIKDPSEGAIDVEAEEKE